MKKITLLDGSIGQELVKRSGDRATPLWSTMVMIDKPGIVDDVHADYFRAGATVATTNTYPVLYDRLKRVGLENKLHHLWNIALTAATKARDDHGSGRVAGSVGPLIASYRPDICPPAKEAEQLYSEIMTHLASHCDVILIETMSSIDQAEGTLRAAKKTGKPFWIALSVDDFDGAKLRSGENLTDIKATLEAYTPEAVLINCSRPEAVSDGVNILATFGYNFGAYANGFTKISDGFLKDAPTVDALEQRHDLSPETYADFAMDWVAAGATIVGGCCEVGPDHIEEIAKRLTENGHKII